MTQIEKEFVPYQEALALKELEFDEPCIASYMQSMRFNIHEQNGLHWETITNSGYIKEYPKACTAPTYSQAFRFFREKYGLIGWVEGKRFYKFCIESSIPTDDQLNLSPFPTYEVAELACLKKLIEIVKNKEE